MSVKRYQLDFNDSGMENNAEFVLASDYDRDVQALTLMFVDAAEQACKMKSERDALAADNLRLREALSTAKYRIEQGRVWNGVGWALTGLHPLGQQKALDAIDAALSIGKEAQ